jgi:exosortase
MDLAASGSTRRFGLRLGDNWPLVLGFAILAIPTLIRLSQQTWTRDFGAYGPIVIATGCWLLWRQIPELRRLAAPGSPWLTWLIIAPSAVLYIFGRAYDFLTLETAGVYGFGLAMLNAKVGLRPMLATWFPLLYLGFAIPVPNSLLGDMTAPLKEFVSWAATGILQHVGVPVARQGVTIFVDQYQLLVEDACSGMNSIVGLIAVSLLYIYLMRGSSWRYSLLLVCLVIPIAIVANIIRIMILILLTYFFGDEVAQSFLHFAAGLVLFSTALALVFALDTLIHRALARRKAA